MQTKDMKSQVRDYWDKESCGAGKAESEKFSRQYFEEIEQYRYATEPEIFSFAQFTRFRDQKVLEVGIGAATDFMQWVRAGAKAYVLKQCTSDDLATAIREVVAGNKYVSPPISKVALKIYEDQEPPLATLTARERDIFHFAAQGLTNAEIARRLFISPRTVECHRARMMRKLGLHRQAELLLYAIGLGIPREQIPVRISLDPAAAPAN